MSGILALVLLSFPAQQPGLSQKEIDEAVARGLDYLRKAPEPTAPGAYKNADELILLTCLHGGMSPENEFFQRLLKRMLGSELAKTYKVSLQAMALEELDRVTHQRRIAQCAQFLVDNMTENGNWHYGRKTDTNVTIKDVPTVGSRGSDSAPKKRLIFRRNLRRFRGLRRKPEVVRRIVIKQNRVMTGNYDNSNSQYASLGLRACWEAGIVIPEQVVRKARQWWVTAQYPADDGKDPNAVASGGDARPRGWSYKQPPKGKPTAPMTAGAIGAVVIYDAMLKKDWKRDPVARSGVAWLSKNYTPTPGNLYYMYAVERAGMLYQTDTFGSDWYLTGAKAILETQNVDGSWNARWGKPAAVSTCFAILFLKKATRMIASVE